MQTDQQMLNERAAASLHRLLPRVEARFRSATEPVEWEAYLDRLRRHFPRLFARLFSLYGQNYDFFYHLEGILCATTKMWLARPAELKALDAMRETDPNWHLSGRMVAATCYVDLFAGDIKGLRERIPYLAELGITYLHLMPVFQAPAGDNDGGYAVSSYREVRPDLGTMQDLSDLAGELRHRGISLTLDFIFNHTSDEHEWARRAQAGDAEYQAYYRMYPDRQMPDQFERSMPEVFTDDHPGAFTYRTGIRKWVWTTFHTYQWDLNYENPAVFNRMAEEMLFLANQGVEILRLDAVAFLWKRLGTNCQNLPEAHWLIQAFNAVARIAAPAVLFKSEAIVAPADVNKYIGLDECALSYNPTLMALLWESLATRDTRVLEYAMERRFEIPEGCAWINYVRSHDDIGWSFDDGDVQAVGFDPKAHRRFLTDFYTGKVENTFARGATFQEDQATGDARVSGTTASLAGIERAVAENDEPDLELAVNRVLLLHGIVITLGGIPLIYLGDEIAMLNDYSYDSDPEKTGDSRWLHRFTFDWERAEERRNADSVPGRVYEGIRRLIHLRSQNKAFARGQTEFVTTGNAHVLGYIRSNEHGMVFLLANFTEERQSVEARRLRQMGMRKTMIDLYAGRTITATQELVLEPYQFMVLARVG